MESIVTTALTFAIQRALSKYVKRVGGSSGTSAANLKASLRGGHLVLQNLELDVESLLHGLPLAPVRAFAGTLRLDIPWTAVTTQPTRVHLENVEVVLETTRGPDGQGERRHSEPADGAPAPLFEDPPPRPPVPPAAGSSSLSWFGIADAVASVVRRMEVSVSNLVLRIVHQGLSVVVLVPQLAVDNAGAGEGLHKAVRVAEATVSLQVDPLSLARAPRLPGLAPDRLLRASRMGGHVLALGELTLQLALPGKKVSGDACTVVDVALDRLSLCATTDQAQALWLLLVAATDGGTGRQSEAGDTGLTSPPGRAGEAAGDGVTAAALDALGEGVQRGAVAGVDDAMGEAAGVGVGTPGGAGGWFKKMVGGRGEGGWAMRRSGDEPKREGGWFRRSGEGKREERKVGGVRLPSDAASYWSLWTSYLQAEDPPLPSAKEPPPPQHYRGSLRIAQLSVLLASPASSGAPSPTGASPRSDVSTPRYVLAAAVEASELSCAVDVPPQGLEAVSARLGHLAVLSLPFCTGGGGAGATCMQGEDSGGEGTQAQAGSDPGDVDEVVWLEDSPLPCVVSSGGVVRLVHVLEDPSSRRALRPLLVLSAADDTGGGGGGVAQGAETATPEEPRSGHGAPSEHPPGAWAAEVSLRASPGSRATAGVRLGRVALHCRPGATDALADAWSDVCTWRSDVATQDAGLPSPVPGGAGRGAWPGAAEGIGPAGPAGLPAPPRHPHAPNPPAPSPLSAALSGALSADVRVASFEVCVAARHTAATPAAALVTHGLSWYLDSDGPARPMASSLQAAGVALAMWPALPPHWVPGDPLASAVPAASVPLSGETSLVVKARRVPGAPAVHVEAQVGRWELFVGEGALGGAQFGAVVAGLGALRAVRGSRRALFVEACQQQGPRHGPRQEGPEGSQGTGGRVAVRLGPLRVTGRVGGEGTGWSGALDRLSIEAVTEPVTAPPRPSVAGGGNGVAPSEPASAPALGVALSRKGTAGGGFAVRHQSNDHSSLKLMVPAPVEVAADPGVAQTRVELAGLTLAAGDQPGSVDFAVQSVRVDVGNGAQESNWLPLVTAKGLSGSSFSESSPASPRVATSVQSWTAEQVLLEYGRAQSSAVETLTRCLPSKGGPGPLTAELQAHPHAATLAEHVGSLRPLDVTHAATLASGESCTSRLSLAVAVVEARIHMGPAADIHGALAVMSPKRATGLAAGAVGSRWGLADCVRVRVSDVTFRQTRAPSLGAPCQCCPACAACGVVHEESTHQAAVGGVEAVAVCAADPALGEVGLLRVGVSPETSKTTPTSLSPGLEWSFRSSQDVTRHYLPRPAQPAASAPRASGTVDMRAGHVAATIDDHVLLSLGLLLPPPRPVVGPAPPRPTPLALTACVNVGQLDMCLRALPEDEGRYEGMTAAQIRDAAASNEELRACPLLTPARSLSLHARSLSVRQVPSPPAPARPEQESASCSDREMRAWLAGVLEGDPGVWARVDAEALWAVVRAARSPRHGELFVEPSRVSATVRLHGAPRQTHLAIHAPAVRLGVSPDVVPTVTEACYTAINVTKRLSHARDPAGSLFVAPTIYGLARTDVELARLQEVRAEAGANGVALGARQLLWVSELITGEGAEDDLRAGVFSLGSDTPQGRAEGGDFAERSDLLRGADGAGGEDEGRGGAAWPGGRAPPLRVIMHRSREARGLCRLAWSYVTERPVCVVAVRADVAARLLQTSGPRNAPALAATLRGWHAGWEEFQLVRVARSLPLAGDAAPPYDIFLPSPLASPDPSASAAPYPLPVHASPLPALSWCLAWPGSADVAPEELLPATLVNPGQVARLGRISPNFAMTALCDRHTLRMTAPLPVPGVPGTGTVLHDAVSLQGASMGFEFTHWGTGRVTLSASADTCAHALPPGCVAATTLTRPFTLGLSAELNNPPYCAIDAPLKGPSPATAAVASAHDPATTDAPQGDAGFGYYPPTPAAVLAPRPPPSQLGWAVRVGLPGHPLTVLVGTRHVDALRRAVSVLAAFGAPPPSHTATSPHLSADSSADGCVSPLVPAPVRVVNALPVAVAVAQEGATHLSRVVRPRQAIDFHWSLADEPCSRRLRVVGLGAGGAPGATARVADAWELAGEAVEPCDVDGVTLTSIYCGQGHWVMASIATSGGQGPCVTVTVGGGLRVSNTTAGSVAVHMRGLLGYLTRGVQNGDPACLEGEGQGDGTVVALAPGESVGVLPGWRGDPARPGQCPWLETQRRRAGSRTRDGPGEDGPALLGMAAAALRLVAGGAVEATRIGVAVEGSQPQELDWVQAIGGGRAWAHGLGPALCFVYPPGKGQGILGAANRPDPRACDTAAEQVEALVAVTGMAWAVNAGPSWLGLRTSTGEGPGTCEPSEVWVQPGAALALPPGISLANETMRVAVSFWEGDGRGAPGGAAGVWSEDVGVGALQPRAQGACVRWSEVVVPVSREGSDGIDRHVLAMLELRAMMAQGPSPWVLSVTPSLTALNQTGLPMRVTLMGAGQTGQGDGGGRGMATGASVLLAGAPCQKALPALGAATAPHVMLEISTPDGADAGRARRFAALVPAREWADALGGRYGLSLAEQDEAGIAFAAAVNGEAVLLGLTEVADTRDAWRHAAAAAQLDPDSLGRAASTTDDAGQGSPASGAVPSRRTVVLGPRVSCADTTDRSSGHSGNVRLRVRPLVRAVESAPANMARPASVSAGLHAQLASGSAVQPPQRSAASTSELPGEGGVHPRSASEKSGPGGMAPLLRSASEVFSPGSPAAAPGPIRVLGGSFVAGASVALPLGEAPQPLLVWPRPSPRSVAAAPWDLLIQVAVGGDVAPHSSSTALWSVPVRLDPAHPVRVSLRRPAAPPTVAVVRTVAAHGQLLVAVTLDPRPPLLVINKLQHPAMLGLCLPQGGQAQGLRGSPAPGAFTFGPPQCIAVVAASSATPLDFCSLAELAALAGQPGQGRAEGAAAAGLLGVAGTGQRASAGRVDWAQCAAVPPGVSPQTGLWHAGGHEAILGALSAPRGVPAASTPAAALVRFHPLPGAPYPAPPAKWRETAQLAALDAAVDWEAAAGFSCVPGTYAMGSAAAHVWRRGPTLCVVLEPAVGARGSQSRGASRTAEERSRSAWGKAWRAVAEDARREAEVRGAQHVPASLVVDAPLGIRAVVLLGPAEGRGASLPGADPREAACLSVGAVRLGLAQWHEASGEARVVALAARAWRLQLDSYAPDAGAHVLLHTRRAGPGAGRSGAAPLATSGEGSSSPPHSLAATVRVPQRPGDRAAAGLVVSRASLQVPPLTIHADDSALALAMRCLAAFRQNSAAAPAAKSPVLAPRLPPQAEVAAEWVREAWAALGEAFKAPLTIESLDVAPISALVSVHLSRLPLGPRFPVDVADAPLSFGPVRLGRVAAPQEALLRALVAHYTSQAVLQAPRVLGSADLILNPAGLVAGLTRGVSDMVALPMRGLVGGSMMGFVSGLGQGSLSLVSHVTASTFTSFGGFSSAVGRVIHRAAASADALAAAPGQAPPRPSPGLAPIPAAAPPSAPAAPSFFSLASALATPISGTLSLMGSVSQALGASVRDVAGGDGVDWARPVGGGDDDDARRAAMGRWVPASAAVDAWAASNGTPPSLRTAEAGPPSPRRSAAASAALGSPLLPQWVVNAAVAAASAALGEALLRACAVALVGALRFGQATDSRPVEGEGGGVSSGTLELPAWSRWEPVLRTGPGVACVVVGEGGACALALVGPVAAAGSEDANDESTEGATGVAWASLLVPLGPGVAITGSEVATVPGRVQLTLRAPASAARVAGAFPVASVVEVRAAVADGDGRALADAMASAGFVVERAISQD